MSKLGTIELSSDVLAKSNIGLWAFELDPDCPPRMYVDDTMLRLIGLTEQISPEETYHAWYDHVDPDHYSEVNASVEKMTAGIHAEVQYPWHHPDGHIMLVRCGGVRNPVYTKGVRIEGTHMNVSDVKHIEKFNMADLLAKLSDDFLNVIFLDPYTGHFDIHAYETASKSKLDSAATDNFYHLATKSEKSKLHPDDIDALTVVFSQSHLIQLLENDETEEITARLKDSDNSDYQYMNYRIVPAQEADGTNKLIIGTRDITKERKREFELQQKLEAIEALSQEYDYVDMVELQENKLEDTCTRLHAPTRTDRFVPNWNIDVPYTQKLDMLRDYMVYEPDRDTFIRQTRREVILKHLEKQKVYTVDFRMVAHGIIHFAQMKFFAARDSSGKIIRLLVAYINADKQILIKKSLQDRLDSCNIRLSEVLQEKDQILKDISYDIRKPLSDIAEMNRDALNYLYDPDKIRTYLDEINFSSRRAVGLLNDMLYDTYADKEDGSMFDSASIKGKHILLVEDNELNREIACDTFEEYGLTIEEAENGKIAVEKCKAFLDDASMKRPDIIFMDCQMPVMDGFQATEEICSLMASKGEMIPIIAMTANNSAEDKAKCYAAGMNGFLAKPFKQEDLEKIFAKFIV